MEMRKMSGLDVPVFCETKHYHHALRVSRQQTVRFSLPDVASCITAAIEEKSSLLCVADSYLLLSVHVTRSCDKC